MKENTSGAYKEFMEKYAVSRQYNQALSKFNERIYFENTQINDLNSYETFIFNYPESPYRQEAEKKIFKTYQCRSVARNY